MLRLARSWWPGVPGDAGSAAVLLWKARRALGRLHNLGRLLIVVASLVAAVALWPRPVAAPILLPSVPCAVASGPDSGHPSVATADGRVWALGGGGPRLLGSVSHVPLALAADPLSDQVYVATTDAITALRPPGVQWRVVVPPEQEPVALALDPALGRLYLAVQTFGTEQATDHLLALDMGTGRVVAAVPVGSGQLGLAVDPRTHEVYLADTAGGSVVALAGDSLAIRATIAVGGMPGHLAVDERAGRVYVTDFAAGTLATIDERTDTVATLVALGIHPNDVATDSATGRVFVADSGAGLIAVLGGDGAPLATLRAGARPFDLVADAAGGRLSMLDFADHGVWRIEDRGIAGPTTRLLAIATAQAAGELAPE